MDEPSSSNSDAIQRVGRWTDKVRARRRNVFSTLDRVAAEFSRHRAVDCRIRFISTETGVRASLSIFLGFSWPSRPALLSRRVDAFTRRIAVHHDSYSSDRHSYAINFNVGTTTKSNRFSLKRTGVDITPPLPTLLPCLPIKKTKTKNSRVQTWRFGLAWNATRGDQGHTVGVQKWRFSRQGGWNQTICTIPAQLIVLSDWFLFWEKLSVLNHTSPALYVDWNALTSLRSRCLSVETSHGLQETDRWWRCPYCR